jgi:lysophospholipase L1-like esterase
MTAGEITAPSLNPSREGSPNLELIIVPSAAYPTQLLTQLRLRYTQQSSRLEVTNSGWSGEWAEDGSRRLPGVMSASRPEAVLLLEGINELTALGTPGVQRAWRAIDTMAKEVRNRGARLFLATLPPTRAGSRSIPLSLVQSLNAQIRITARGENAVLVDIYEALSPDAARFIGPDGVHPTEAGYQRMAETFFAAIRADLERRTP